MQQVGTDLRNLQKIVGIENFRIEYQTPNLLIILID